jgi:hypothetical protein
MRAINLFQNLKSNSLNPENMDILGKMSIFFILQNTLLQKKQVDTLDSLNLNL